ncbi:MAG TPA: Calx-beta domain-containing protein [Thermoanaerobaculia bacterium]|nr:Calx-beta domain-containing protein [Thermoanaerobaculia bacterium]
MKRSGALLALFFFVLPLHAAVHIWTGASSDRFSDAGNWRGGSPAGDAAARLSFPGGPTRLAVTNDLPGLTVKSIAFSGSGYVVSGNAIVLTADAEITNVEGVPNELATDLILSGGATITAQPDLLGIGREALRVSGAIRGTGPLTKIGGASLAFAGTQPNTYSGATRVLDGALQLTKANGVTSVPGDLLIGSTGANGDIGGVATFASEQIADSGSIRVEGSSRLLVGAVETIGPLSMQGNARLATGISFGQFTAGAGTVILTGDITLTPPADVSLSGDFALAGIRTITAACDCDFDITNVREHTPGSGLILRGPGFIPNSIFVTGTYRGPTVVESGRVHVNNPNTAVRLRGGTFSGNVASLLSERGTVGVVSTTGDLRLNGATTVSLGVTSFGPSLSAGGVFDISRARLDFDLDNNFRRTLGATYVVGNNKGPGPIIGTFAGVAEGEILLQRYRISYRGGDGNDLTFTDVGRFSTNTSLQISASDPKLGDTITLIASVISFEISGQRVSTGQVTFREGNTVLGTRAVNANGVATIDIQPSWAHHVYSATYEGDATYMPSSDTASVHVDAPAAAITSIDPDTLDRGATATITLRGTGFLPGGTVSAAATTIPTTFVSSTEVRFTITAPNSSSTELHITYDLGDVRSNVLLLKVKQPPPPADSPILFDGGTIRGPVAPGGSAAWLSVGLAVREGRLVTQAQAAVTPDSNHDGIALWEQRHAMTGSGLAVMVDMTDRRIIAERVSGSSPAPLPFPRATFLRDPSGNYTHVMIHHPEDWNLLWVRPGVGAWYYELDDGGAADLDRSSNDILVFNTSSMFAVDGVTAPTPSGIQPGDVFIGIDWEFNSWFGDVVDEHLRETDGPGSVRFADTLQRSQSEKSGVARFTVLRTGGTDGTASVDYATIEDTAIGGIHFGPVAGRLTFGPGEILRTFEVPILHDAIYSGDVKFRVALTNPVGAPLAVPNTLTVTVRENDPQPVLSIQNVTVTEGDEGERVVQWTASISGATRVPVTGRWGYAAEGVSVIGGSFTFVPGGPTSQTFTARYTANRIPEPDRFISVFLRDVVNAAGVGGTITVTDDDLATLTILDATVSETRTSVQVLVSSDTASFKPVTVRYESVSGTATDGSDFTGRSGTLSFDPTTTLRVISIPILPDALNEGEETFTVRLFDVTNARLRNDSATVTIVDDDAGTIPVMTVSPVLVDESLSDSAVFTIRLSFAVSTEVRVRVRTVNGSAVAGEDFEAADRIVTISPGETRGVFLVRLFNDSTPESLETFSIALSEPVGATILTPSATATIVDRDSAGPDPNAIAVSVTAGSVIEGNSGTTVARFTVRLSRASTTPVTVAWATADGSAVAGSDYVAASGTLTFAPGETEKSVDVLVRGDAEYELDETFSLVAGTSAFGVAHIVNDDDAPVRRRPSS